MKRLKFLLGLLLGAVMLLTTSCHGRQPWSGERHYDASDSVQIASLIENAINPVFIDVKSMLEARATDVAEKSVDSLWETLPDGVLTDVFSVMDKKGVPITKKSLIETYRQHSDIYDNLPAPQGNVKSVDKTATDIGSRQDSVFETTYNYRTDTVNGKPIKVQIKTEYSYAR